MDREKWTAAKLCCECGGAAKWVKPANAESVRRYLCGKDAGTHRRVASNYRTEKWSTEWHAAAIAGFVEMIKEEQAESLVAYTQAKRERDSVAAAARAEREEKSRIEGVLSRPESLRRAMDRAREYQEGESASDRYQEITIEDDEYYGVAIKLRNIHTLHNREQAEELVRLITEEMPKLDEAWAKWHEDKEEQLEQAEAERAALQGATV